MGSFSIWHWLIVIIWLGLPLFFILRPASNEPNRFGPPSTPASFTEAISRFFKNYVNFSGRATRSEFWYAVLTVYGTNIVLTIIDAVTFGANATLLSGLFSLGVVIPSIALACRRLHDLNRSGWNQILAYMFPVGTIGLLFWYCKAGTDAITQVRTDVHGLAGSFPVGARQVHSSVARTQISSSRDVVEMLERLSKLKKDGAITEAEYEAQKRRLLR